MNNTLDRIVEQNLVSLIDGDSVGIQCVPNLLAGGEANAILPRVVVACRSKSSPDFQSIRDGFYGVRPIEATISSIAEATNPLSSAQMEEMNSAVDNIVDNPILAESLSAGTLKVYGTVPGEFAQEGIGNRIIRRRVVTIWARLQPITSEPIITEDGQQIVTEDGQPIYTE
jgi:hypothetical protein